MDQMQKSINRSYQDDPDINVTIEKFLDTIEYVLFFPLNYGVNCMVNHGCQESSFADDEQTTSSASFSTSHANQNAGDNGAKDGVEQTLGGALVK